LFNLEGRSIFKVVQSAGSFNLQGHLILKVVQYSKMFNFQGRNILKGVQSSRSFNFQGRWQHFILLQLHLKSIENVLANFIYTLFWLSLIRNKTNSVNVAVTIIMIWCSNRTIKTFRDFLTFHSKKYWIFRVELVHKITFMFV